MTTMQRAPNRTSDRLALGIYGTEDPHLAGAETRARRADIHLMVRVRSFTDATSRPPV